MSLGLRSPLFLIDDYRGSAKDPSMVLYKYIISFWKPKCWEAVN